MYHFNIDTNKVKNYLIKLTEKLENGEHERLDPHYFTPEEFFLLYSHLGKNGIFLHDSWTTDLIDYQ